MVYKRVNIEMKKAIVLIMFAFASFCAYAFPSGCYEGSSRPNKGYCRIYISGKTLSVRNKSGEEIARWTIVSETSTAVNLESSLGARSHFYWGRDSNGNVTFNWNYDTYKPL